MQGPYVEPAWVRARFAQTQVLLPSLGLLGLSPSGLGTHVVTIPSLRQTRGDHPWP